MIGDSTNDAQVKATLHANGVNLSILQPAQLWKLTLLQANKISVDAKLRQTATQQLLHSFCSRKMLAVDQMQRSQFDRG
jgi:hypothetical protein